MLAIRKVIVFGFKNIVLLRKNVPKQWEESWGWEQHVIHQGSKIFQAIAYFTFHVGVPSRAEVSIHQVKLYKIILSNFAGADLWGAILISCFYSKESLHWLALSDPETRFRSVKTIPVCDKAPHRLASCSNIGLNKCLSYS